MKIPRGLMVELVLRFVGPAQSGKTTLLLRTLTPPSPPSAALRRRPRRQPPSEVTSAKP